MRSDFRRLRTVSARPGDDDIVPPSRTDDRAEPDWLGRTLIHGYTPRSVDGQNTDEGPSRADYEHARRSLAFIRSVPGREQGPDTPHSEIRAPTPALEDG
jgi:hypothetical protein